MIEKDSEKKIFQITKKDIFFLFIAFLFLIIFWVAAELNITPPGLEPVGLKMIGILILAAILWITEPIPLPVTGLFIIVLQPIMYIMKPAEVFSSFGNQAVFFLIGAFIIAAAIEKHNLHKRIALLFLSRFDQNPKLFTLGIMFTCAFLSFIMPEHGVAALFLPIVISVLVVMKIIPKKSNFGKISMLSIAYGCSIGSLGTLIGGARNPLAIAELAKQGYVVGFFDWMIYSVPIVLISLPLVWLILQFTFPIELDDITEAKKEIKSQVKETGNIKDKELLVLFVLISTIIGWIAFSNYLYVGLAVVAIIGAFSLFLLGCVTWKDVEKRVPWGIILLYGGAITLGHGVLVTGAGEYIANQIISLSSFNLYLMILLMILITIILTNLMSNIAAVAIILPIGISISNSIVGMSPLLATMLIALSGGLAFMFVISTPGNAITYSSGYYSTKDLFKAGFLANILCIAVIFVVAIVYWIGILNMG